MARIFSSDNYMYDLESFDFSETYNGDERSGDAKHFIIHHRHGSIDVYEEYTGRGFKFNENGDLIDGTISSIQLRRTDGILTRTEDIKLDASDLYEVGHTASNSDDIALLRQGLDVADDVFRGGALADTISTYGGNDKLFGGRGDDELDGGAGNDTIDGGAGEGFYYGGAGKDTFVFSARQILKQTSGGANIEDFEHGQDTIELSKSTFRQLDVGKLSKDAFYAGTQAHDSSDRILFDESRHSLLYDPDGNGAKAAVEICKIYGTEVSRGDIEIV